MGSRLLILLYRRFLKEVPKLAKEIGVDARNPPYVDFERLLTGWLLSANAAGARYSSPPLRDWRPGQCATRLEQLARQGHSGGGRQR